MRIGIVGAGISGLTAAHCLQRRHLASPRFLRMLWDIRRFYREGRALLDDGPETPMLEWLERRGYSNAFVDDHFLPLLRAVWSANREVAATFPARFLVRFFENHGFLQLRDAPRWLTIPGGARTYVNAILRGFSGDLRLGAAVRSVRRTEAGPVVTCDGAAPEQFDHLIVACHADQALALLVDPSELERQTLGAIPYQRNEAVLHTDEAIMPNLRRTWASWNVHLDDAQAEGACLTYWMNRLQPLGARQSYFVTLNHTAQIRPERILRVQEYAHPVFTLAGVAAQANHAALIDHRRTSYAGAYWRNGFHEDGVVSALRVVKRLDSENFLAREAA